MTDNSIGIWFAPDYDENFLDEDDEDQEFLDYSCGWMPGGGCSKAGTEECDWSCPINKPGAFGDG